MEDANFFEVVASAASGDSCKSPSSVKSGTAAAVVGGQVSFEVHSEFVFPPTSSNLSAANTEVSALRIMLPTSVCMLTWDVTRKKIRDLYKRKSVLSYSGRNRQFLVLFFNYNRTIS